MNIQMRVYARDFIYGNILFAEDIFADEILYCLRKKDGEVFWLIIYISLYHWIYTSLKTDLFSLLLKDIFNYNLIGVIYNHLD